MKRLDEYSNTELMDLTDDQIESLIDLECAYDGISLLPPFPGPAPAKPETNKVQVYEIAGYIFTKQSDANLILDTLNKTQLYRTDGWGEDRRLRKVSDTETYDRPKIENAKIMSQDTYERHQNEIAAYTKKYKMWERQNENYNNIKSKRGKIEKAVRSCIDDAFAHAGRIIELTSLYRKYHMMAEGNSDIAINFLVHAEDMTPEEIQGVREECMATGLTFPDVVPSKNQS